MEKGEGQKMKASLKGKNIEQKYYKVAEIAKIFGLPAKLVRDMCHARGQKFAFRPVPNGNFRINKEAFERHIERRTQG